MVEKAHKTFGGFCFENTYEKLPQPFYTFVEPTPVKAPRLALFNEALAQELGLNSDALVTDEGLAYLVGNKPFQKLLAMAYAGHQFGHFTLLGDGRAVLLGEHMTPDQKRLDIQLKGSGPTPYSRSGDGRAALGPMLREYIMSEAIHSLGIPTTRSLAVVHTGEPVFREKILQGAVLTRVAASHIRVGTFQYIAHWGTPAQLKALADYVIQRHYPECSVSDTPYLALLHAVISKQAALVAQWQLVGFIHGVMNTDNMSISGETIDYGPCAFMDQYHPATVFSSIDKQGRYAYSNQPLIAAWNLGRLAEALLTLFHEDRTESIVLAQTAINTFEGIYSAHWLSGMGRKLGLLHAKKEDENLIQQLLQLMDQEKADFTNTFRDLTLGQLDQEKWYATQSFQDWHTRWQSRLETEQQTKQEVTQLMKASNPNIIPRNHFVEAVLADADLNGDFRPLTSLLDALKNPYEYSLEQEPFTQLPKSQNTPYRTFCGT